MKPLATMLKIIVLFCLIGFNERLRAATCLSTGNGNWANATTWSCGHVPTCGDSVVIQAAHSVTINSQQDLRGCGSPLVLVINGSLRFVTGNKLRLACNSRVYIFEGGTLVPGGGGGNSNELEICNATVWQASYGTYTGPACLPSTLTACAAVLPIQLISFNASACEGEYVCFEWSTASEKNNKGFTIEASTDAVHFERLSDVETNAQGGNSNGLLHYKVRYVVREELRYFRLRQHDFSGQSTLSQIVVINRDAVKAETVSIVPNPNSGNFSFAFNHSLSSKGFNYDLILTNTQGVKVFEKRGTKEAGSVELKIMAKNQLKRGVYFYTLVSENHKWTGKLVVVP